jgi:hypothetical protein
MKEYETAMEGKAKLLTGTRSFVPHLCVAALLAPIFAPISSMTRSR